MHSSLPFCPLDPVFFQKPLLAFAESVIRQLHMWFPFLKSDFFSFFIIISFMEVALETPFLFRNMPL